LLGQKVSIVSRKVQTTRFSTKGILNIKNTENNKPDCQIIFVDTPGLFEPKKALEKHIVKNTISELNSYEHICVLYDATSSKLKFLEFSKIIKNINLKKKNSSLIINKIDLIEKEKLLIIIKNIQKIFEFKNVFMVSAKKGQGCKDLIDFHIIRINLQIYLKEYILRKLQEKNFLIILILNYLIIFMLKLSFGKKQKNQ
jgi:GTP-binding protein Era